MDLVLTESQLRRVFSELERANAAQAGRLRGQIGDRHPVHTVYGGAQLFRAETIEKLGEYARSHFQTYGVDAATFAAAIGLQSTDPEDQNWLENTVFERVKAKLHREAVEDFRVDFEDGFGFRADAEEDEVAKKVADEMARALKANRLSPFIGIRIKSLSEETKKRSVRTLDLFLARLLNESGGVIPPGFVITIPKTACIEHVQAAADIFDMLETHHKLPAGALKLEIMIETTTALLAADGRSPLSSMIRAGRGRIVGVHFGTYDYTAHCDVAAPMQAMSHPAAQFALQWMKVAFAGEAVALSDGASNTIPVGPHRIKDPGPQLTPEKLQENTKAVHSAWRVCFQNIQNSLRNGFYQGWDLHPGQIPVRYAATYSFFLDGLAPATQRLRAFVDRASQATLSRQTFDDAATGQGLLNFFLRAYHCGAMTSDELQRTGLTLKDIESKSFFKIVDAKIDS
ncbi:aldolase [Planctomyces bekefii]|uniref:Aldolase n=1 Tax=Planctomyces bekefii TaxID=1653850 RepID=A0A5C6ME08_9PLAN|nr:aldolase [Planctomyces bekefii]